MITDNQKQIVEEIKKLNAEINAKIKTAIELGLTITCTGTMISNYIKIHISKKIEL
jgi:hypothetical protein